MLLNLCLGVKALLHVLCSDPQEVKNAGHDNEGVNINGLGLGIDPHRH